MVDNTVFLLLELYALCRYMSSGRVPGNSEPAGLIEDKEDEDNKESSKTDESELRLAQLQHQLPTNEPGVLMHLVQESTAADADDADAKECRSLFKNLKFYLSREVGQWKLMYPGDIPGGMFVQLDHLQYTYLIICLVFHFQVPRESLLFIIPAFGGTVSWEGEGAPFDETDEDITHQVYLSFCKITPEVAQIDG